MKETTLKLDNTNVKSIKTETKRKTHGEAKFNFGNAKTERENQRQTLVDQQ